MSHTSSRSVPCFTRSQGTVPTAHALLAALVFLLSGFQAMAVDWFFQEEGAAHKTYKGKFEAAGNASGLELSNDNSVDQSNPFAKYYLSRLLHGREQGLLTFRAPTALSGRKLVAFQSEVDFKVVQGGFSDASTSISFNYAPDTTQNVGFKNGFGEGNHEGLAVVVRVENGYGVGWVNWKGQKLSGSDLDLGFMGDHLKSHRCRIFGLLNGGTGVGAFNIWFYSIHPVTGAETKVADTTVFPDNMATYPNSWLWPLEVWNFSVGGKSHSRGSDTIIDDSQRVYVGRVRIYPTVWATMGDIANSSSDEGVKFERDLPISDPAGYALKGTVATSSDPLLTGPISVSDGRLSFTPPVGKTGTATITVSFTWGILKPPTTKTFQHTVNKVNHPPTLDAVPELVLKMNKVDDTLVNLSGITAGLGDDQLLTVTASSANKGLVPDPVVDYTSPNAFGTLRLRSVRGQSGSTLVTVTVRDQGGLSLQRTFNVSVAAPDFVVPNDLTIDEDSAPTTLTIRGIADGDPEKVQALSLTATSSLPELVATPVITYDGKGTNAQLMLTLKPNANSAVFGNNPARIQLSLTNEDGASKTASFAVTVSAVADKPLIGTSRGVDFAGTGMAVAGDPGIAGKSFTVELWAKRHLSGVMAPFFVQGTNGVFFGVQADDRIKFGFAGADGLGLMSPAPYTDTDWHHWAATYDATTGRRRIYRDGFQVTQDTVTQGYSGTGSLYLGGTADARYLNGAAQELRLWRVARSAEELLSNGGSSLVTTGIDSLLGYWRADEGDWPRLENIGTKGDLMDGIFRGAVARVTDLSNLSVVAVPTKVRSYPIALPAFNPDTSSASGLTYAMVRGPANGKLSDPAAGQVTFTANTGFAGSDSFSYKVLNGTVASETVEVALMMRVINTPPTIAPIPDQVVYSSGNPATVVFTIADDESDASSLTVNVSCSDTTVLPLSALQLGGTGGSRTLTITPQANVFASPTVTLTVTDGASSVQRSFVVRLAPSLAYRVIALPGPSGSQTTLPTVMGEDGRIGGYGDTLVGGVPRAFVNLGFLNNFTALTGLLDQNNGRVTALVTANGLQAVVGDYFINNEWRAYLLSGGTFLNLGKPTNSSGSRALGANSSLQVVGYSTITSGTNEKSFLSTGNPDAFTDISPAGTTTSRAVAINDSGEILIRSGASGSYKAWRRAANGAVTDIGVPSGYSSPNPVSLSGNGIVLAEVTSSTGTRRMAQYLSGAWTVLEPTQTRWSYLEGGRINGYGIAAATARTNSPTGASVAVLNASGKWYALNDLISDGTGWNLETATALNEDGFIVGTGRRNGVLSAYLAVPANIIGQRVPLPSGAVGRYPSIQVLDGGVDDSELNSFIWSEVEKSLYAIRPVTARIRWFTTTDVTDTTAATIPKFAANIWPRKPDVHVATVPVDTEPQTDGATFRFASLAYTTDREARVDPTTKKFNSAATNGTTYTVFQFLKTDGRSPDPLYQTNAFLVFQTLPWQSAPLNTTEAAVVGQTLSNAGHIDYPGKNGYLFYTNSIVDVAGEQAAYDQDSRSGPLNVVNTLANARNGNTSVQAPLVVWYQMTPLGVALPNRPVTYQVSYPTNASRIIIASLRGNNHDATDPITSTRYPEAQLYVQPDRTLPGFNPNEEHALIAPSDVGNAVYALRNDLNAIKRYSEPFALLKYRDPDTEEWRIKPYAIVIEQAPWFLTFEGDAGKEIQPPLPLSLLPLTPKSYVSQGDWFQDYNSKVYARAAGPNGGLSRFVLRWFYPLQPGFFYDLNGDGFEDVSVGAPVAWLDRRSETVNLERSTPGTPIPTVYNIRWPDAPVLEAGQTLTTPVSGLPDVRNMANVRMIYDSLDPTGQNGLNNLTRLFDPISERYIRLSSTFVMPSAIKTATDTRGRQVFVDLPYAIRARLSYDAGNKWLYFGGYEDRSAIGEPLVLPNILTPSERDTVKALANSASGVSKTQFTGAIDALYDLCRNPNRLDLNGDGVADQALLVGLTYGTNVTRVTINGVSRTLTNAVPEVFGSGPKALTAADATVPPAMADPGKALAFPATSSQLLTINQPKGALGTDGNASGLNGSFTIEFWIYNQTGSTTDNTLVRLGGNSLKALKAGYRSGYMSFEFNTQRVRTEDPVLSSDINTWVHYAFVFDADAQTGAIYRNGNAVGFAEGFSIPLDSKDTAPLYFGADPGTPAHIFVGMLDEIRLWDGVARRGSQLAADSRKKMTVGREGLAGYWRFDTASGNRAPDDSGHGLDGVVAGASQFVSVTDAPYGIPPRYVTLLENNDPTLGGLPVSLKIIEIDDGPYRGDIKVLPNDNVFDSRLILRHSSDFAGRADNVEFEWWYHPYDPIARTNLPSVNPLTGKVTDTRGWIRHSGALGLNQITLGGSGESGLLVLSDNWFVLRFRGFNVNGDTNWSDWVGDPSSKSYPAAMLAEGWIKRVIRGLNPFDARATDFNSAEASTVISMLQQAGARYEGDIAFNPDPNYLNSIGLIEAYQTVLNRGKALSIEGVPAVNYGPANDALLLAASRIADLYALMGNEAMADAADPTIGFTTGSNEYGATASSIFAFQNQLDSLLEEELALLRGRDDSSAGVQGAPVYNRLLWNFTLGDGEIAYSQVYNMADQNRDGRINETDARTLYPQGHGDAWGHYLTAVKGYYDLLRHPNFTWQPRSEAVLLAGVPVKVDYLDERKFATLAANKAKAGSQIVDLTYRDKYVADPAGQWQGYTDTDATRGWGVSEWAQRAASAAYFDWLTGNAILPSEDPDPEHTGLDKIDRQTVGELAQISAEAFEIVGQIHKADNGLNPLGLVAGAVPFDIDPAQVSAGKTHFEQVAERAKTSLLNARTLFDEANAMTVALRSSADSQSDLTAKNRSQERELENKLIEIYGYPYAGDIGSGKAFPSGYSGPDLIHYLYVDTADVNGDTAPPDSRITSFQKRLNDEWVKTSGAFNTNKMAGLVPEIGALTALGVVNPAVEARTYNTAAKLAGETATSIEPYTAVPIDYPHSSEGYAYKAPTDWGQRRAQGEIQVAIQGMVQQEARFKQAVKNYENLLQGMDEKINLIDGEKLIGNSELATFDEKSNQKLYYRRQYLTYKYGAVAMEVGAEKLSKFADATAEALPKSVGLSSDATAPARGAIKTLAAAGSTALAVMAKASDAYAEGVVMTKLDAADRASDRKLLLDKADIATQQRLKEANRDLRQEPVLRLEMFNQREALDQAAEHVRATIAKGQRVLEERRLLRADVAGDATKLRYRDMAYRMFRNEALNKYRSQFDLAARYVYLAATAYDYEVNLIGKGNNSGTRFLTDILRHRTLGQLRVDVTGVTPVAGRMGLADPLARLSQNFTVQKTQMGFNNPQTETGRFSLRNELFRLRGSSDSDWKKVLKAGIVNNVWDLPDFRRFCRPFAPESAGAQPALVLRFPTTVTFGLNFFGWPLGGGDSAYDPSNFATKVRSVGVWFSDYNGNGLSMTPRVYLVPVGADVLRAQDGNDFETRMWRIVDQKIPIPFEIGQSEIKNANFQPALDSLAGNMAEIRKFSSFRAYHDSGGFSQQEASSDSRLIGRSVWNTEWMLVIPGGTLLNDPNAGLDAFIDSVSDIKLFFQTYAYSGN